MGNPRLAHKLSSISQGIHYGRGVVVLRGLDAANFNDEEAVIAFVGVCSYVCPERATDSYANQTLSKCDLIEWTETVLTTGKAIFVMPPRMLSQGGQKTLDLLDPKSLQP